MYLLLTLLMVQFNYTSKNGFNITIKIVVHFVVVFIAEVRVLNFLLLHPILRQSRMDC